LNWLASSLIALICWGLWGLLIKIASKYYSWHQVFIVSSIATITTSIILLAFVKPSINFQSQGFTFSLFAGIAGALALVTFNYAMQGGQKIIIVPLTALYPIITIILSYLVLHEEISLVKAIGILLGLAAIILISYE
jgi:transporter family protein